MQDGIQREHPMDTVSGSGILHWIITTELSWSFPMQKLHIIEACMNDLPLNAVHVTRTRPVAFEIELAGPRPLFVEIVMSRAISVIHR